MHHIGAKLAGLVMMLGCSAAVIAGASATRDKSEKLFKGDPLELGGLETEAYQVTEVKQSKEGNYIVYAFGVGYNESAQIHLAAVFDPAAEHILNMKVIEQNETPGLGAKIAEEEFTSQFAGMAVPVTVGGLIPKNPNTPDKDTGLTGTSFDAVTAATISSKGVARILNNAYFFLHDQILP